MADHYFTSNVPASDSELRDVTVHARGHHLVMSSADRVFSSGALDPGTRVLLDVAPPPPQTGIFLDLGCGWGPIAALLALEAPDASVWAVDVSERALDLTARNAARLGLSNIFPLTEADALERAAAEGTQFDLIWSNPPVRIGKAEMLALLDRWLSKLSPEGVAYLAIAKNLGGDSAARWLADQGYSVKKAASKKGFRVLEVRRG